MYEELVEKYKKIQKNCKSEEKTDYDTKLRYLHFCDDCKLEFGKIKSIALFLKLQFKKKCFKNWSDKNLNEKDAKKKWKEVRWRIRISILKLY